MDERRTFIQHVSHKLLTDPNCDLNFVKVVFAAAYYPKTDNQDPLIQAFNDELDRDCKILFPRLFLKEAPESRLSRRHRVGPSNDPAPVQATAEEQTMALFQAQALDEPMDISRVLRSNTVFTNASARYRIGLSFTEPGSAPPALADIERSRDAFS